ncbi:hypothetical protein [Burkholderia cepacia]|uniref:hypothetical protein n=1 Tax=Burkholderia cepacia TaxID=292 RepID=UPI0012D87815|nr:hypothetical protein [Burkholderia cepacia]
MERIGNNRRCKRQARKKRGRYRPRNSRLDHPACAQRHFVGKKSRGNSESCDGTGMRHREGRSVL